MLFTTKCRSPSTISQSTRSPIPMRCTPPPAPPGPTGAQADCPWGRVPDPGALPPCPLWCPP
jgi:hypothetical protein